jgi:hypothetical protein
VALDNGSVDTLKSMTAKGLLATLIRAKDGDDVTVEGLCKTHTEGREMLTKAMRALVEDAFVVKFKIQRKTSETITLEDGSTEQRRGGSWWTTFTVDSIPFTADDVTEMLQEIFDDGHGNVKAVRVEPTRLDRRERASDPPRPTDGKPSVGATCGNGHSPLDEGEEVLEESGSRPTDGFPTVGGPTVGASAAHIRKKTSLPHTEDNKTGEAPSARSAGDARRASAGSSARNAEGGSAASAKDDSSSSKVDGQARPRSGSKNHSSKLRRKHTAAERAAALAVRRFFPKELDVPDIPAVTDAILEALAAGRPESRTVEQLGARIDRRWYVHGWARRLEAGERIEQPVGVAIDLVRAYGRDDKWGCANSRCEDGADIDTGEECRVCPERLADRRWARKTAGGTPEPSATPARIEKTATGFRECPCRNPIPKGSNDHLCRDCRKQADYDQAAALAAVPRQPGPPEDALYGPPPF